MITTGAQRIKVSLPVIKYGSDFLMKSADKILRCNHSIEDTAVMFVCFTYQSQHYHCIPPTHTCIPGGELPYQDLIRATKKHHLFKIYRMVRITRADIKQKAKKKCT